MNSLRNSVQLIGHLGSNPELKKLETGTMLATVNIATRDSYKDAKGEYVDQTTWHRLVGWGKLAETMEKIMTKGREVAIRGKIVNRSYDDKNGIKRYVTEIRVNDFALLGKNPNTVGDFDVAAEKEAKVPF